MGMYIPMEEINLKVDKENIQREKQEGHSGESTDFRSRQTWLHVALREDEKDHWLVTVGKTYLPKSQVPCLKNV